MSWISLLKNWKVIFSGIGIFLILGYISLLRIDVQNLELDNRELRIELNASIERNKILESEIVGLKTRVRKTQEKEIVLSELNKEQVAKYRRLLLENNDVKTKLKETVMKFEECEFVITKADKGGKSNDPYLEIVGNIGNLDYHD